jgi:hypothetical protein
MARVRNSLRSPQGWPSAVRAVIKLQNREMSDWRASLQRSFYGLPTYSPDTLEYYNNSTQELVYTSKKIYIGV